MGGRVHEPVEDRHVGQRHLDRLIMLSDGVFAIAITLSAIEIKPESSAGLSLWQAWSKPLLLYFLSFLLIGVIWANHRRIVAHLRDIDAVGTAINMVLLSLVALMPVVIRFSFEDTSQQEAFAIYAVAIAATFTCMLAFWVYAAFIAKLAPDLDHATAREWLVQMILAPLVMLAAVLYEAKARNGALAITLAGVLLLIASRWFIRRHKDGAISDEGGADPRD
ncbi:Uncharacterized membrane protein [Dyella sp. OK004]|uniref:TMEM175 family protein n=1 Tax=Dyella sp. OK004 TaxID=1855292 RepID=UPI0008EC1122|nr:TMEM175 family protein [Dyella sp. OK004]SFS08575.1 Uncharacterized membrane protein [Dyella sp. OK004]